MSGGSTQTGSQTTSSAPWQPAQGKLKGILSDAKNLYNNDSGFKAYGSKGSGNQAWTDFSSQTQNALDTTQNLASQPNQFYQGSADFTNGLINGQYNLDQSGYKALQGQGPNTEADYRAMLNNSDADFNNVVQNTANDLGDQIQRQFGGASYGAGQNADYLTKGVGDQVSKMRSDNYFNNQNLKQGLLNSITGVQQQGFDNQRGLLGDMSNLSQQDIANRQSGVGMADSVYNSQYLPAQQMAQVGNTYDTKNQQILDAKMNKYNTNQMSDWDRLSQYFGIASGTGQQGQRATTTTSQPSDPWSKLLGGGLLASQIF